MTNRLKVAAGQSPIRLWAAAFILGLVSGCGATGPVATSTPSLIPAQSVTPAPSPSLRARDIWSFEPLAPIEPGTYFIDPDLDPSTSLRVLYDVPADGWSMWAGGAKFSDAGHVGVSITTVVNLVRDGCQSSWADPPVGPSVNDLATALAALAPFQVTSPPADVTIYGYSGKHLEWTVPDLPVTGAGDDLRFTGCVDGKLKSWVAPFDTAEPGDAYYGYTGPGYVEEFWILDVEGTRLMIASGQSPRSSAQDILERDSILDSIRIEP